MAEIATFSSRTYSHSSQLEAAQQAPRFLDQVASAQSRLVSAIKPSESSELWINLEQLLLACLRTGDDQSAHKCLDKLTARFGDSNERIMGLRGLVDEAVAVDDGALLKVLQGYDAILKKDSSAVPIIKRRITLLRTLSKPAEAISAIVQLLEMSPTDAEAWAELSDMYMDEAMYPQAIFCLEEVLLITPNAWNIHTRLGEVLYVSSMVSKDQDSSSALIQAIERYCRSIELCNDYVRGYYGLKLATGQIITKLEQSHGKALDMSETSSLSISTFRNLNELASKELMRIIETTPTGYEEAELISAKALLDRDTDSSP